MGWVKLTDQRALNAKLRRAGLAARGLDEAALCQVAADGTDGHISRDTVEMLAVAHNERRWQRLVDQLVEVGRWVPEGDGWRIDLTGVRVRHTRLGRVRKTKITRSLRAAVLAVHGDRCLQCGTGDDITMDHVIPESRGGPTEIGNLRPLCRRCNSRKGVR